MGAVRISRSGGVQHASISVSTKTPITVVVREADHDRLTKLCAGSVFIATGSRPDANGMVDGTCGDNVVLMFTRDLEERAEPIAVRFAS